MSCQCGSRDAWIVWDYKCNYSAFNGYRWTPSKYSTVHCDRERGGCGAFWRTKAAYVDTLPRGGEGVRMTPSEELNVLREALELIARGGCESYTWANCWDSGRTRGAQYTADAWCLPCVAQDALNQTTQEG